MKSTVQESILTIDNIMPAASDILQFMRGQICQTPQLLNVEFTGKTVVVTGANSGLGFECAKHLQVYQSLPNSRTNAYNKADSTSMFRPLYSVAATSPKEKQQRK